MVTEISADTIEIIDFFRNQFKPMYGEGHYILACHAAFPIALTPDLLYQLWANFRTYTIDNQEQSIHNIAISDLLLSNLCREVSREIYEMDVEIRAFLLNELEKDSRFGKTRMNKLGYFLYQYIQEVGISRHPKAFVDAQIWTALATIAPQQAVSGLQQALSKAIEEGNNGEVIRMRDLLEAYANQESAFENLMHYTKGLKAAILGYPKEVVQEQFDTAKVKTLVLEEGAEVGSSILEIPLLEELEEQVLIPKETIKNKVEEVANKFLDGQLKALLIGINDYHPDSGVPSLDGCVNDVKAMEQFIKTHYGDLLQSNSIKILLNKEATREKILQTFSLLANRTKVGDTVLIYFAGYGSYNQSSEVFKQFDGRNQDETFVCYDSRLDGNFDLADIEITVLLSRIKEGVDIIMITDSCYSASITRNVTEPKAKTRFYRGRHTKRALENYLLENDNYYQDQLHKTGRVSIPNPSHLLLSSTSRAQEAFETSDKRGLFTTVLLNVLSTNQDISYSHLLSEVRTEILAASNGDQQPTLNAWESFNPNTVFLRKNTQPNIRHLVEFKDGAWQMAYGAIYGLPSNPTQAADLTIGIFESQHPNAKLIEQVKVDKINLGTTVLSEPQELGQSKIYWGEIQNYPTALSVNLEGTEAMIIAFNKLYNQDPSIFVRLKQGAMNAKYTLALTNSGMTISTENGVVIKKTEVINETNVGVIKDGLDHIAKWETTANLKNESDSTTLKDTLEFTFFQENKEEELEALEGTDFTLTCKSDDGKLLPIWYQIQARNVSREALYIALLHLSSDFEINTYFQSQILEKGSDWKVLDTESRGLVLENNDSQTTDIFKIIVSNKPFDERKFLLPKVRDTRGGVTRADFKKRRRLKNQEDWFAHTITVDLVRQESKVGKTNITLLNDKIKIKGHPYFKADLSLGVTKEKATRSVAPWNKIQQRLVQNGVELLNLEIQTRSINTVSNIIELSNIENPESLRDTPLELNVQYTLDSSETIIPITFDGIFIIPIGTSEKQADGSIDIKINHLPTYDDTGRAKKTRSLTRAGWFSLIKLTRFEEDISFKLRKVYYRKGVAKRTRLRKSHIRNADKILLVIHGLIGNTKSMIKNLEFLEGSKKYDLIITFDYENLNTKIEDIAAILNERLENFGLSANDDKFFDILAHSMGGLVSRYMIEFIRRGDSLVDNLFMFGTPNGRSVFGDIPVFRDKLTAILTIGLNYGKSWLGTIGIALDYFNKFLIGTKALTITLSQMSTEGDFIDQLANSEVKMQTKYTIVSGDITDYESLNDPFFSKLMDSILLKIGNFANDEPNDIALMVKDIRAVPQGMEALKYDVCCHHMNYFEEGEGLRILKEIMT